MKKTSRIFTLSVPTGNVETCLIRTYMRDTNGVDYPVDKEIEVDVFETVCETVDLDALGLPFLEVNEAWILQKYPANAIVIEMKDVVTIE